MIATNVASRGPLLDLPETKAQVKNYPEKLPLKELHNSPFT